MGDQHWHPPFRERARQSLMFRWAFVDHEVHETHLGGRSRKIKSCEDLGEVDGSDGVRLLQEQAHCVR